MLFFLLPLLIILYANVSLYAMKENADSVTNAQYNNGDIPDYRIQEYEVAFSLFHDLGIQAVYELEQNDQEIDKKKREAVKEFMAKEDTVHFYCKKDLHKQMCYFLELLPDIYLNKYFEDLIKLIKECYKILINNSTGSDKLNRFKQLQKGANIRIEKIQADRETQKRLRLENKVFEILKTNRDELGTMVRTDEQSALYSHLTWLCTSFDVAQNSFQDERISTGARLVLSDICFMYSYWSWLNNNNERALEFGQKAHDVADHLLKKEQCSHNYYTYWVTMLSKGAYPEQCAVQDEKIFKKRKLPHPKTVFQKKQHVEHKHEEDSSHLIDVNYYS